jgi:Ser/Thr protein kinase RdoA (MazF antagonist)
MNYTDIKISTKEAENILFQLYNIKGKVSELPGEIDFNFRIKTEHSEGFILKISRPNENEAYLDFQQKLIEHINQNNNNAIAPKVIKNTSGHTISSITDSSGNKRHIRLLTWISGRLWSNVNPQLDDLRFSLGQQCGLLTKALQGFYHSEALRKLDWDTAQSLWTKEHLDLFTSEEKEILNYFQQQFEASQSDYSQLRKSVIHNDGNDNNIVVSENLVSPKVKAVIDFGDAVFTQTINDLATTCAYALMHHNDPLEAALPIVKGYHDSFPLEEKELKHLYNCIAMRLVISVTKSAINKIKEPDNKYLLISEKPAWQLLKKWHSLSSDFAHFSFRAACGFSAHPNTEKFTKWALTYQFKVSELFPTAPSLCFVAH